MMSNRAFVKQRVWDDGYESYRFRIANGQDKVRQWLEHFLNNHRARHDQECLEIGCFPGQYLAIFGDYGYRISGIDLTPRTNMELNQWLRKSRYKIGRIIHGDFFAYRFEKQFDIVYSLGFIEHFSDWQEVIRQHISLVRPGGYLILCTPNFKGLVQYVYHRVFDKENLFHHNLDAMDPKRWSQVVTGDFQILESGYFGGIGFWTGAGVHSRLAGKVRMLAAIVDNVTKSYIRKSMAICAPFCGLIARKAK